jgi:hypothetical protein
MATAPLHKTIDCSEIAHLLKRIDAWSLVKETDGPLLRTLLELLVTLADEVESKQTTIRMLERMLIIPPPESEATTAAGADSQQHSPDAPTANRATNEQKSPRRGHGRIGAERLPGPAPWQAPQSAHREDDGEERGHTERDERPDEEKVSAGVRDTAADADTLPLHMDDGDGQRKERPEEDDDVPRSAFGEHQRSVQPNDTDGHSSEV